MARSRKKDYETRSEGVCDLACLKGVLIAFNFLFIVGGLAALGVGIWTIIAKMEYSALLTSPFYTLVVYMLMAAGVLVLLTGIVGCIGAIQKRATTLTVYTILLIIILIIELLAGILAFVHHETIHEELSKDLKDNIVVNYNQTGQEAFTLSVDKMQQNFQCCGVEKYSDWKDSRFYIENQEIGLKTPESCCKTPSLHCSVRDHPSNIYRVLKDQDMGCLTKLEVYLKEHLFILAIAGIAVAGIEILVIIFACCLRKAVLEEENEY